MGYINIVLLLLTGGVFLFSIYRYYRNRSLKDTKNLEEIIRQKGNAYVQNEGSIGLVVGVVKDDKIFIEGFGKTQKTNGKTPDANTLFELASITKVFTTSTAQILVDKGEINWKDSIEKYLPKDLKLSDKARKITLFQLATHTSGLPRLPKIFFPKMGDEKDPYKDLDVQDIYNYLETCEENSEVGKYAYSNLGMGLLGHILELKIGKSFESIVKEEIVEKLNMKNTTITLSEEQKKNLAQGYDNKGNPTPIWENKALAGAGSFISNAKDMCKFLSANLDSENSKISNSLVKTHKKYSNTKTGLGWHFYSWFFTFMTGERNILWHNGATGGYRTFLGINKNQKSGVIILSNSNNDVTALGMKLSFYIGKISLSQT